MRTLGIDFDTNAVHVVSLEEDGAATYHRYDLPAVGDAFERTREIPEVLPARRASFWDDVLAVGIEEPQGAQRATVAKLKAVQGAILACIPRQVVVEPFVPAAWRKAVGLKGNATKADVVAAVGFFVIEGHHDLWAGTTVSRDRSEDACDAYCLALAVAGKVEVAA